MVKWRGAGSPVSGSAPVAPAVFLNDTFPPLEYWGLTKEVAAAPPNAFQVERVSNGALTNIPWAADGKNASAAALSVAISGSTGRIARVYGQKGISDLVQTTAAARPPVIIDTDGKISFDTNGTTGLLAETPAAFKTAKVHVFMTTKMGACDTNVAGHPLPKQVLLTYQGAGTWWQVARWGMSLSNAGGAEIQMPQNGQSSGFESQRLQGAYGQAHMGKWTVWGWSNNTFETRADKTVVNPASASTDITYVGTDSVVVGLDLNAAFPMVGGKWRGIAFYGATQSNANWNAIVDHYINNTGIGVALLPTQVTTPNAAGFTWTPEYIPTFFAIKAVDLNNIGWVNQHGGYDWSFWTANNVNNGVDYVRLENRRGDAATIVDSANRCEQSGFLGGINGAAGRINPGEDLEVFYQFLFEPGPIQDTNDWCDPQQIHYADDGSTTTPDLFMLDCKNDVIQPATQRDQAGGPRTFRGTSIPLVRGTWYAIRIKAFWSVARNADTLEVWMGTNGGTLTKTANITASGIFDSTANFAYIKRGIYRGFPANTPGSMAIQIANFKMSKTSGAYAALVTTQPALPTHP